MFDDRSDEQLRLEPRAVRCMMWGYRQHEHFTDAVLTRVLAMLTERQADKVLTLWNEQHDAVRQDLMDHPTKRPTWTFGEFGDLTDLVDEDD